MTNSSPVSTEKNSNKVHLHYSGSKGWLIFWLIVIFPVGLMLLATSGEFEAGGNRYYLRYDGSRFWLCFWTLACFPIAIILLLLNGISVHWGEPL